MAIRTNLFKIQIIDLTLFYFLFHFIFLLIFPEFIRFLFFSFSLFLDLGRRYDIMMHVTVTVTQSCNIKKNIETIY